MHTAPAQFDTRSRLPGVAATIALHLVIIVAWLLARQTQVKFDGPAAQSIQWVDVKPLKVRPTVQPEPAPAPVARMELAVSRPQVAATSEPAVPAEPDVPVPASVEPAAGVPVADAPPARSADDIMQQARRDIGKISSDIKKELPLRGIRAPIDTPQKRLVKGIALAHELAPGKWYERPKMAELIDPGGQGRRRYRVMTAAGPMCWTVDAPHTPNGRDQAKGAGPPKLTNCPPDEEPAKAQEW